MTNQEAVENQAIQVMDKAALGLATEHNMPLVIFDAMSEDGIIRAVKGEAVGTNIR